MRLLAALLLALASCGGTTTDAPATAQPSDAFCQQATDDLYPEVGDVPVPVAGSCDHRSRHLADCPEDAVCAVQQIRDTGQFGD